MESNMRQNVYFLSVALKKFENIWEQNVENRIESCLDWQIICEAWMK